MLERYFGLRAAGTTVRTEILAGATTFLTMAYITFVNPQILSVAGMDFGAVFVATCLAAATGSALMGLLANYPVALAPGMGLNAYFAYGVVQGMGFSWQVALGAVFLSGVLAVILSILPVRQWIIDAIPRTLKLAISAGIGLFLALIGLKNAGIVVAHPATFITLGDVTSTTAALAALGFFAIVALDHRRVPGAIIIGIFLVTAVGIVVGVTEFKGIVSAPPSLAPVFLKLDIAGALEIGLLTVVFAFLFVDLFDTAGTLVGLAHRAGMLDPQGRLPRLGRALVGDSSGTVIGACLGTSSTTSYVESAAGINAGGRTGLTAVVVGGLFLAALFLSPLAQTVPAYATAPALLFVACLMTQGLAEIDWRDGTEAAPAVVTALAMPFTFSIANGIALGFITYAAVKILAGRFSDAGSAVAVLAALFIVKFMYLSG